MNVKKCMCWCLSIIELKNTRWNTENRLSLVTCPLIPFFWAFFCSVLRYVRVSFETRLLASSCPSVRPSVPPCIRMYQLDSHWMDFRENWYLYLPQKFVNKIQIRLKSDENFSHFKWRPKRLYIVDSGIKSLKKTKINKLLHFHNSDYMATMFNWKTQRTYPCQSSVLFIQYCSTISVCSLYLQIFWGKILHCVPCAYTLYRIIHKSLRNFRTRLRNNQDIHGRKEHVNR